MTAYEHDAIVLQLYEHASDDTPCKMIEPWPTLFRSAGIHSILLGPGGAVVEGTMVAFQEGAPREYEEEWRDADPRMALATGNPGNVFSDVHHIDPVAFEKSDVYHAVLRPFDLRYSLFGSICLANGYSIAQAMMRSKTRGAYDTDEVAIMARLAPHVRRAFDLRIELRGLRARVGDLSGALDVMPSPVFVLDANGRILHFNACAEAVLGACNSLVVRNQRLATTDVRATAQLRAAVTQALTYADHATFAPRSQVGAPTIVVDVPRDGRSTLLLVVHPVRPRVVLRSRTEARARALVVVHDPDARMCVDRALLQRIHGLTPTEAELAASLSEGKSLTDFATERGCSTGTARTHLKHVLEKTGTRRQAELVYRILATTALHAAQA